MDTQHEPEAVEWVDIDASGQEIPRTGDVFCAAPPFRAARTVWAVPHGECKPVRVVLVGRGHHVGSDDGTGRWLRTGGRLVSRGEAYREIDERSALALDTADHRRLANLAWSRARARVRPSSEETFWFKIIEEYRA